MIKDKYNITQTNVKIEKIVYYFLLNIRLLFVKLNVYFVCDITLLFEDKILSWALILSIEFKGEIVNTSKIFQTIEYVHVKDLDRFSVCIFWFKRFRGNEKTDLPQKPAERSYRRTVQTRTCITKWCQTYIAHIQIRTQISDKYIFWAIFPIWFRWNEVDTVAVS